MKKSLLLLSTLGAASAAFAQSNVSLSGTMDLAVNRTSGSLTSRTQLNSGSNATSKLIFRGTEDLGGGNYALFWLEGGLAADTGGGNASNTNNQPSGAVAATGLTFNRRSIVGLGGTWGVIHAGRDWSPTYDAYTGRYDVFGVGSGIGLNYTSSINPQQVRVSNGLGYTTPKVLGGLSLNLQHWRGENAGGTATSDDGTGSGFRFNYDSGPISAVMHYARTTFAAGDAEYRAIAAHYNTSAWRLAFNLNSDEQGTLEQRGFNVGGIYRIGVGEIKASYSLLKTNAAGSPQGRKLAVGYVHNLSKRTAVYTTLAQISNKNGATFAISGSTTAANKSSRGIDVGIRHNF
jgi:predicted porin